MMMKQFISQKPMIEFGVPNKSQPIFIEHS